MSADTGRRAVKPRAPASARGVASAVLLRIEADAAYAAAALDAELDRAAQLDPRHRALATEIVYGVLRTMPVLDEAIAQMLRRGTLADVTPRIRVQLRIAAYQLFFLDRVPAFAAVNEAVDAVRLVGGEKGASFANAVLRKLASAAAAESSADGPSGDKRGRLHAAVLRSAPEWLRRALVASVGEVHAEHLLTGVASDEHGPPIGLRVEYPEMREEIRAQLAEAAPQALVTIGKVSPLALLLRNAGDPHRLPGYAEARFSLQEEGSQLVALALGAQPGETVLDACAGRGGKSAILARAVGGKGGAGAVDVCDVHPSKLTHLRRELGRLDLAPRRSLGVDWSRGSGEVEGTYDAVLVDAPCSGSGTLRRRPDVLLRRTAEDVAELARLQADIATTAASHVRPGGRFVYAVCSVLEAEAEEVIGELLRRDPGLRPAPFSAPAVAALVSGPDVSSLRLLPDLHGTDGYFVASFLRSGD
jgi:16S rRNA (cytosine967-C5)-methyltransferase